MTMLMASEPRLALAVEPPAGSPSQPVTLAGLQVSISISDFRFLPSEYGSILGGFTQIEHIDVAI